MLLIDTPAWLRRAVWAVVTGVGVLALLAIVQQVTKTYGSTYGGFASVLPAGDAMRSAGPLNPNPFGQILATSAVLAFYLARVQSRPSARALAAAISLACLVAAIYTQSRAALIALLIVAIAIAVLHGVRLRVLAVAVCVMVALAPVVLPNSLDQRLDALSDGTSATASFRDNNSLRGRTSENLAAVNMWADHPLLGVGPDNFEAHYQTYSAAIGIDQRAEARGAHNLYLESFAELGLLGAATFLGVIWLSLRGAWRARSRLEGRDALLCEGLAVALGAFLICALTLHSAYARYEWIFLGLGLAAGCLARRPAR
jgi:putative inorganic carbon (HCO3(-)) transporter